MRAFYIQTVDVYQVGHFGFSVNKMVFSSLFASFIWPVSHTILVGDFCYIFSFWFSL